MKNNNQPEVDLIDASAAYVSEILDMMESFNAIDNYPFNKEQRAENIQEIINNKDLGRLWIIMESKVIVGYLALAFGFSFEYGGRDAIIDEFFIKESNRNHGIGQIVLQLLSAKAESLSVKAIHLEVESGNQRAHHLYEQNGFQGNERALLTKIITH